MKKYKESETVELKEILTNDINKEIIAFANTNGGTIYIGVNDDGEIIGLDNVDEASVSISNSIRDSIKPDLTMFTHYEELHSNNKNYLKVSIQPGTQKPYYIASKGLRPEGVYVRQGFSSAPASDNLIRNMIKSTDGDSFELMRSLNQDLTFIEAKKEFNKRKLEFKTPQMKTLSVLNHDNLYTNVGLLLSDQCPYTIKVAVFEGLNQNTFKDRKEFSGSLFKQMNDVYEYLDLINKTHSTIDGLYRNDSKDYPQIAIREALLNMLIHRDYSFSASSFIKIFDNRIEFISYGGLPKELNLNDILQFPYSAPRNKNLANIFYRLSLIEAYGLGIERIMNAYTSSLDKPKFETSDNLFEVTLYSFHYQPVYSVHESPNGYLFSTPPANPEKRIRSLVFQNGFVTRKDVEQLLSTSPSTATRLLRKMVNEGKLEQVGKARNTKFYNGKK